jgi:hypothetical protein
VCGFLGGAQVAGNPIDGALPAMLRLDIRRDPSSDWVRSTFRFAADEIARGRVGSEAVMAKLSELLFVEAVRRHVETLPDEHRGWLAGLKDPFVSRAMALLHARIAEPWTVDGLGRQGRPVAIGPGGALRAAAGDAADAVSRALADPCRGTGAATQQQVDLPDCRGGRV